MKNIYLFFLLFSFFTAEAQTWQWAKREGYSNSTYGRNITCDQQGNVYAVGSFNDSTVIGSDTLVTAGSNDIFLVKYDSLGNFLWVKHAGGAGLDYPQGITTDNAGNIYISGVIGASASFGNTIINASGKERIFFAKYTSSGSLTWVKTVISNSQNQADAAYNIKADASGYFLLTGSIRDTSLFDTIRVNNSFGNGITFIAKYDTAGNAVWVRTGEGNGGSGGIDVSFDGTGNVYGTGNFNGTINLGNVTLNATGQGDFYVVKYDPSGNFLFALRGGGTGVDEGYGISALSNGDFYLAGEFMDTATIGTAVLTTAGGQDIYLAKFNLWGQLLWIKQAGGTGDDIPQHLVVNPAGDILIAGRFENTASFDTSYVTSQGYSDIFLAGYTSNGNNFFVTTGGGAGHDGALDLTVSYPNNIYITGYIEQTAVIGSTTLVSAGFTDFIAARFSIYYSSWLNVQDPSYPSVHVYPIPAKRGDQVTIEMNTNKITSIHLYNNLGQLININPVISNNNITIDTHRLVAGMYFYSVIANGTTVEGKFVVE